MDRPTKEALMREVDRAFEHWGRKWKRRPLPAPAKRDPLNWHNDSPTLADVELWWLLHDMGFGPRLVEPLRTRRAK